MIKLIPIICMIIFPNLANSDIITGSELQGKVKAWLNEQGQPANIKILPKLKFNECDNLIIQDISTNFKLIKISCSDDNGWAYIVRNKNKQKKQEPKKVSKSNKKLEKEFVVLNKFLKKGEIIKLSDLKLVKKNNRTQNSYFINKNEVVGMKLKRNLKENSLIKSSYLEKKWLIHKDSLITIENDVGPIIIKIDGIALQNGDLLDEIKVKNLSSGQILSGFVENRKKVILNAKQF